MKAFLVSIVMAAAATTCFGQGYVAFNNTVVTRISTNGLLQAAAPIGTYYYALLVAPSTQNTINNSFTGWTFVGMGTNTAVAGRMTGNTTTDSAGIQVPGYATTATADFAVVGWTANIGTDWNSFRAWWNNGNPLGYALSAISSVAQDILLAPLGGPYNSVWGSSAAGQIQGLNLTFIPEPGSGILILVAVCAVLCFRLSERKDSIS